MRVRDEELSRAAVICATAWYALPVGVSRSAGRARRRAARGRVHRRVADRHRQPLVRSAGDEHMPSSGCRAGRCSGCSTSARFFGDASSHLSLVSSGAERARGPGQSGARRPRASSELTAALPAARGAVLRRAVVVREKRATFSVAPGPAAAAAGAKRRFRACFSPATGSIPASPLRSRARSSAAIAPPRGHAVCQ